MRVISSVRLLPFVVLAAALLSGCQQTGDDFVPPWAESLGSIFAKPLSPEDLDAVSRRANREAFEEGAFTHSGSDVLARLNVLPSKSRFLPARRIELRLAEGAFAEVRTTLGGGSDPPVVSMRLTPESPEEAVTVQKEGGRIVIRSTDTDVRVEIASAND